MLATISFDLKFTYVLVGWEGSAHDSRVLNDAFARPGGFTIPEGIIRRNLDEYVCIVTGLFR